MEETLGKRIVQNRKRLGLTQDALAEKLGVTAQAVSKWENDQSCPDITMLPRLAAVFGVTTDALLGLEAPAKEAEVMEDTPGLHIDNQNGHWEFKWDGGRRNYLAIALWVISTALMLLAGNILNQQVGLWSALWTTALALFGLFGLCPKFSVFRLGCALAGGYFIVGELWPRMFVLDKSYILPIVLLLFGLKLLAEAGKKNRNPSFHITSNGKNNSRSDYRASGEAFDCDLCFGSRSQPVELPRLKDGTVDVAFGELTLDLGGCGEFAPGCHLDLDCTFGSLNVLLPSSVRAEASSDTAFGNFTVIGQPKPDAADTILINADVSFGEIILRYI